MKVIKNINNNVSLCLDSRGREVVAFGKGIGYKKPPYEIPLREIQRTFYNINADYLSGIQDISEEILGVSTKILDYANERLNNLYSSNVVFTLADHIQFAIKRRTQHINLKLPIFYEVQNSYPTEMEIALDSLKFIKEDLKIVLPYEEAAAIALHLVDHRLQKLTETSEYEEKKREQILEFIEKQMEIKVDRTGFNYSRFVTHIHYLLERIKADKSITSENRQLFEKLKEQCPKAYECAKEVRKILGVDFSDEELLYLILHINRLGFREDCYR